MRRHEVHCLDRGGEEPESLFLSVSSLGFIRKCHSFQQTMPQISDQVGTTSPSWKVLLPGPTAIWDMAHPKYPLVEMVVKEQLWSKTVGLCGASFSWEPLLCSAPWCSPELCCGCITAQFNTFQILALISQIILFYLVSHPSCPFVLFGQFELWECMGFCNL